MKRTGRLSLVDVFSGMGCASMGFEEAGFEPAVALEIDPLRCDLYRKNVGIEPIQADVMAASGKDLLKAGGLKRGGGFFVVGCPPCQSFSSLADTRKRRGMFRIRSGYVRKFTSLVIEMMPLAVVFENVQGMVGGPGKRFFDEYLDALDDAGYRTRHDVVNAADFGVPQNRKRVIAVSVRKDAAGNETMDRIDDFLHSEIGSFHTVRDAIGDLVPLESGEADPDDLHHKAIAHSTKVKKIISSVPRDGGSRKELPIELWLDCHKNTRGAQSSYGRMRWDSPSPTLTCRCTTPSCGRFTHPFNDRGITIREAARLQTIPDSARLSEHRSKNESIIGDAVPVLLARKIAENLRSALAV